MRWPCKPLSHHASCDSTNFQCRYHKTSLQNRAQTIPKFTIDDNLYDDHAIDILAPRLSLAPPDALQSASATSSEARTTASLVICKICFDLTGSKSDLNRERVTYHMNAKFVSALFSQASDIRALRDIRHHIYENVFDMVRVLNETERMFAEWVKVK